MYPKSITYDCEVGVIPLPPTLWPRSRGGILCVVNQWYDSNRVSIDTDKIELLPVGTIEPISVEDTLLNSASLSGQSSSNFLDKATQLITLGAINHMFWDQAGLTPADSPFYRYEHNGAVGALAMTQAFESAWSNNDSPINKALNNRRPLDLDDIASIFGTIPAPESRRDILNQILLSSDLTRLSTIAQEIGHQHKTLGVDFAAQLADSFPLGYADEVLKKAQLATSGLWRIARQVGSKSDCDVTAFADYQIPNVLRAMNLLTYSDDLASRIDSGTLIEANAADERALRAASILAVELIAKQQYVDVADVDYWLWLQRKVPTTPFHRTRTTLY